MADTNMTDVPTDGPSDAEQRATSDGSQQAAPEATLKPSLNAPQQKSLAERITEAFAANRTVLERLQAEAQQANDATLKAREDLRAAQDQAAALRVTLRGAKDLSTTAASRLLVNMRELTDRKDQLSAYIGNTDETNAPANIEDLLKPIKLQPADIYRYGAAFMTHFAGYDDELLYDLSNIDMDDDDSDDEDWSTPPSKKRRRKASDDDDNNDPKRRKDEHGDTDDDSDPDNDSRKRRGAASRKDDQNGSKESKGEHGNTEDDNNSKRSRRAQSQDSPNRDKKKTENAGSKDKYKYTRSGKRNTDKNRKTKSAPAYVDKEGKPLWSPSGYLIACSAIIDRGSQVDPEKRYAELACPQCKGNFVVGKSEFTRGMTGLRGHAPKCEKKFQFNEEAAMIRFHTYEEVCKIAKQEVSIEMKYLYCPSRRDKIQKEEAAKQPPKRDPGHVPEPWKRTGEDGEDGEDDEDDEDVKDVDMEETAD